MLSLIKIPYTMWELLETIRSLGYGEMFGVVVRDDPQTVQVEVNENERDLIKWLEENSEIDILTVHNGKPVLIETDFERCGFRCRKKLKLPTG